MQQFDLLFAGVFFSCFVFGSVCASFNVFCDVFNLRPLILLTVIGSFFFHEKSGIFSCKNFTVRKSGFLRFSIL